MFCVALRHRSYACTAVSSHLPNGSHLRTGSKAGRLGISPTYLTGSAHGLLIGMIVPYGLAIDALMAGEPDTDFQLPILVCLLLGATSMLYSIWAYRAQPILNLAHLVTIVVAVPAVFVASVAVVGWT